MEEKGKQVVTSDYDEPIKTKKKKNTKGILGNLAMAVVAVGSITWKIIKEMNKSK